MSTVCFQLQLLSLELEFSSTTVRSFKFTEEPAATFSCNVWCHPREPVARRVTVLSKLQSGKKQFCIFSVLESGGGRLWPRFMDQAETQWLQFGSSWHLMERKVVEQLSLDSRCASVLHLLPERRDISNIGRYISRFLAEMVCLNLSLIFLNLHWNASCILHHRTTHQFQGPAPVPALPQGNGGQMKQSFQHNAQLSSNIFTRLTSAKCHEHSGPQKSGYWSL